MSIPVIYVAHPLGGDVAGNAARARRWLRYLMDSEPDVAWCCPWLPFVDIGRGDDPDADEAYRDRCLRDDIAIAAKCDGIVLCGSVISTGMQLELVAVILAGGKVHNLVGLTDDGEPPSDPNVGAVMIGENRWTTPKGSAE